MARASPPTHRSCSWTSPSAPWTRSFERLQNEFLRLQEELAKTILFVTHDIDEAIKMGDLVAVMQTGGILAQFAPPEKSSPTRHPTSWPASSVPTAA